MLRRETLEALQVPCSDEDARSSDDYFETAIGAHSAPLSSLRAAIFGDLDEKVYGIGWWAPSLGPRRRILISDQLVQSAQSVQTNLAEARLHVLSFERCLEDEARHVATMTPRTGHPRLTCAADALAARMATMHVAGFFRSIGSALDCLGAAHVGVLALRRNLLRTDLGDVRRCAKTPAPNDAGSQLQQQFLTQLEAAIAAAGPAGWFDWTIDFRNTFVHRARRYQPFFLQPELAVVDVTRTPIVLGQRGRPVPLMPQDPGHSDIEDLSDPQHLPLLTESGLTTLHSMR
jgi:hypothetical protein